LAPGILELIRPAPDIGDPARAHGSSSHGVASDTRAKISPDQVVGETL